MADVVTRFKLETTQFDSKLRDASKSLADISREASKAGKGFADFTKDSVEAARALGQTESSATNTKDKLKELVNAFNDAAKAYNGLTQEQKQSDFGKAMADSLDTLKGRIADTKQELQNVGNTMKSTSADGNGLSGILGGLADKFGVNISQLGVMGTALGATSAAVKVATDAFFASEANVDEWGRVVESSRSLYEGFLNSINTGDISGFLSRIDQIVAAARAAYDELDRLGSMRTIQAPQISAQQTENERMRQMIQTGRYIAPTDGRRPTPGMTNGQVLTPGQIQAIERQLGNGMNKVVTLVGNEVKQTSKAIEAEYNRQSKVLGMSMDEFKKGTSSMAEFDKRVRGAERLSKWIADNTTIDLQTGREIRPRTVPKELRQYRGWDVFRVDGKRYNDLVGLIQQRDQQAGSAYSMQAQAYRTINRAEGITTRSIMGGGGGGTGGGRTGGGRTGGGGGTHVETPAEKAEKMVAQALLNYENAVSTATLRFEAGMDNSDTQQKKLLAAQERLTMAYADAYNLTGNEEYKTTFESEAGEYNQMEDVVKGKRDLFNTATQELTGMEVQPIGDILKQLLGEDMQTYAKRRGLDIDTDEDSRRNMPKGWEGGNKMAATLGQVSGSMGQLVSGVEELGIDVPEGIEKMISTMQAVQTILSGISTIVMVIQMLTMKNSIPIIGRLANGGIIPHAEGGYFVPGTSYSGDVTPIMANAGELVLNRAQQGNLASQLQGGMGNMHLEAVIEGEDIRLALQNGDRRRGRGEYVTSKTR